MYTKIIFQHINVPNVARKLQEIARENESDGLRGPVEVKAYAEYVPIQGSGMYVNDVYLIFNKGG